MAEMTPADVPRDLAVVAAAKLRDCRNLGYGEEMIARRMLAAVLPLIQQQTRAAIAAELEQHAESIGWYEGGGVWAEALNVIRRGGDRG